MLERNFLKVKLVAMETTGIVAWIRNHDLEIDPEGLFQFVPKWGKQ